MTDAADKTSKRPIPKRPTVIRAPEFGARLQKACEGNQYVPPQNRGRLTWISQQFTERFNEPVSIETVRKWMNGEVEPLKARMTHLAQILDVDENWLRNGVAGDMAPRERRLRNATLDGAVNLVAGIIQMSGGHPAFPEENDERARENSVDIYAIIKGARYDFHVSLAQEAGGDTWKFTVPAAYDKAFQLGVIQEGPFSFSFYELTPELIQRRGQRKGGSFDVTVGLAELKAVKLKDFANRL